ncbi:MAG: hypothetical protein HUJ31_16210 [Pseudomonadales bacterium]|nr:hypothetical protein [Pseudomonadales bacterium]
MNLMALPTEIPGRRERREWIDLGNATLCMMAKNLDVLGRFYERLGFVRDSKRPQVIRQGWTVIAFLDFQPQACVNFRGASIVDLAFEFAKRGYSLSDGDAQIDSVPSDGSGAFFVYDPDGHRMFFNTHPHERERYEAWKNNALAEAKNSEAWNVGANIEQNTNDVPMSIPFGRLVASLDVGDLQQSLDFYGGLGFDCIERTEDSATVYSKPWRPNRYEVPVKLRASSEGRFSFGFLCEELDDATAELERRGVDLHNTAFGPAFEDPDGNVITLYS